MALLGFMRLGPVLLVVFPALSLACDMLPAPDQALNPFSLEYRSVLNETQADLEQCREACCNRTDCDIIQVNVNQEGAGPNCMLIRCIQDPCLRHKDQKQDQVQIYHKNRTRPLAEHRGPLSPLMIPDTGTEEGSPAHNETETETDQSKNTNTKTDQSKNTETKTDQSKNTNTKTDQSKNTEIKTGVTETTKTEEPDQSDQDKNTRCRLPKKVGPCRAAFPRFFYNLTSQTCSNFTYGGCKGNDNNFLTVQECEDTCEGVTGEVLTDDATQINAEVLPSKGVIKTADSPSDSSDMTALCFAPPDSGRCRGYFPMFYYNPNTNECKGFIYGGCQGNKNRHSSMEECMNTCSGGVSFGARGQRRNWTAGVFLFVALAAISALLLGTLIAITLRRNRLPCHPPSSISDKEELLHDDASSLDSVGIPPSPGQSQA